MLMSACYTQCQGDKLVLACYTGSATPLHHSAWGGGQTPMHPSLDDRDTGFPPYNSSRGPQGYPGAGNSTPAYTGTPYGGDDYRQVCQYVMHVRITGTFTVTLMLCSALNADSSSHSFINRPQKGLNTICTILGLMVYAVA